MPKINVKHHIFKISGGENWGKLGKTGENWGKPEKNLSCTVLKVIG